MANENCILYPRVDHDVQQDEDEERQDLEEDVGDARHLDRCCFNEDKTSEILN